MKVILVALWVHHNCTVVIIAVIPRAQKAHADKCIHTPALGKVVLVAGAESENKAEALAVFVWHREEFTTLKELWFVDIKAHTADICSGIEAVCGAVEVVAILTIEHTEEEVAATNTTPR